MLLLPIIRSFKGSAESERDEGDNPGHVLAEKYGIEVNEDEDDQKCRDVVVDLAGRGQGVGKSHHRQHGDFGRDPRHAQQGIDSRDTEVALGVTCGG